MFIEVEITEDMLTQARNRERVFFEKYGNNGTLRTDKPRQRMTGYLAEIAVKATYSSLSFSPSDAYDFVSSKGKTIDVKAQGCNSKPLPFYDAALYANQTEREVDFYIFCRVKNDFSKVWIAPPIERKEFFKRATLKETGTVHNNFTLDEPRYEVQYKFLQNEA